MNLKNYTIFLCCLMSACASKQEQSSLNINTESQKLDYAITTYSKELNQLKDYFQIPGLAVLIQKNGNTIYEDYLGWADVNKQIPVDSSTLFPMASLTKMFSSVLLMKLVEAEKLSLDDPIKKYLPDLEVSDSIQIKHVLSHTSQGKIGENFYYSFRFGWLTKVIEKASGQSFEELMQAEIFEPLALKHSLLMKDSAQLAQRSESIAQPYFLEEGGIEEGFMDYGFSSSAGLMSTVSDLAIFSQALEDESLISAASFQEMSAPFKEGLPYGYGIFSQEFEGKKLIWAYGQYDCHASLFLKVPSENLTAIIAANNNLMSDPARLINGDASSSLFVMSILKNFVFNLVDMPLMEIQDEGWEDYAVFYREKLLAQALSASFMARYDTIHLKESKEILEKVFSEYPDYEGYADVNILHTLNFLKTVAFFRELGEFNYFDSQIEKIGAKLFEADPENPYVNIHLGTYYDRKGEKDKAKFYYENIVNANNFSPWWYTQEAKSWLEQAGS